MQTVYLAGMFKTWPTRIRVGFMPGFADCSAPSFTPYLRAMPATVSPEATVCVRGLMAAVALPERFVFVMAGWTGVSRTTTLVSNAGELVLAAANWLE